VISLIDVPFTDSDLLHRGAFIDSDLLHRGAFIDSDLLHRGAFIDSDLLHRGSLYRLCKRSLSIKETSM
jgi:hypothetical protein